MECRPAKTEDLPQLKEMYRRLIERMYDQNICIWDEVYPCEFFREDIEQGRLYVLTDREEITAAFVLCDANGGAGAVQWENAAARAVYIDRLGVNVDHAGKGVGSAALQWAAVLAVQRGAQYLRLFVVDCNEPAIRLYLKNGFRRAGGVYDEVIDEDLVLRELGLEKKLDDMQR